MKKYLILLFLTLISCNNPKKVWDFTLGESKTEVESTLKNKDYSYHINDGKIEMESYGHENEASIGVNVGRR